MKIASRFLRLAVVPLLAAGVTALAVPAAASATPAPSAAVSHVGGPVAARTIHVQMTFVPARTAGGRVAPANTVHGNCGSAWMSLGDLGSGQARASFGFDLDAPYLAIGYAWNSTVAGTHIVANNSGGGTLLLRDSWDGGVTVTVGDGYAFGYVFMTAKLVGNIGSCQSLNPTSWAIVT